MTDGFAQPGEVASLPGSLPVLPGYEILRHLGTGTKGLLYLGRVTENGRVVVIQVVPERSAPCEDLLENLRLDAETLTCLHDPHLVPLRDLTLVEGKLYLIRDYIPGESLRDKLHRSGPLEPRAAARLLEVVARALHAAHQAGIIHGELAPAHVVLTGNDGSEPEGALVPRLIDLGLLTELEAAGVSGPLERTASYVAPEQVGRWQVRPGVRSDIYALGAILYECLTGRPPFQTPHTSTTLDLVRTRPPLPPSQLQPNLSPALERICLHCLEKQPARRYETALALADDLQAYLVGKPIQARAPAPIQRLGPWVRAHPILLAFLVVVVGLLAVGAQHLAEMQRTLEQTEQILYLRNIAQARQEWEANRIQAATQTLQQCPVRLRHWEWFYLRHLCIADAAFYPQQDPVTGLACTPDNQLIASAGGMGVVRILEAGSGAPVRALSWQGKRITSLAFNPTGNLLAAVGESTREDAAVEVRLWSWPEGQVRATLTSKSGPAFFVKDGRWLVAGPRIWEVETEAVVQTMPDEMPILSVIPESRQVVVNTGTRLVVRRPGQARPLLSVSARERIRRAAVSKDGAALAALGGSGELRVWDGRTGKERFTLNQLTPDCQFSFSPDGRWLACGRNDASVGLWDAATGTLVRAYRGLASPVTRVVFSADGSQLVAGSQQGTVQIWPTTQRQDATLVQAGRLCLAINADGDRIATDEPDGAVVVREVRSGRQLFRWPVAGGTLQRLLFSPEGNTLVAGQCRVPAVQGMELGEWTTTVQAWDLTTGEQTFHESFPGKLEEILFSLNGSRFTAVTREPSTNEGAVRVWDGASRTLIHLQARPFEILGAALSPDGTMLAEATPEKIYLWDLQSDNIRHALDRPGPYPSQFGFSPRGGKLLLYVTALGTHVWDTEAGFRFPVQEHVSRVVFRPDGRCFSVTSGGSHRMPRLELHDLLTGEQGVTLDGASGRVVFSPDSQRLATLDEQLKIWDAASGRELLAFSVEGIQLQGGPGVKLNWSRDGSRLMAGATVWEAIPFEPVEHGTETPALGRQLLNGVLDLVFSNQFLMLLALWPVLYVATLVHELGHALLARWNGFTVTSCGVGLARPVFVFTWSGGRYYLAPTLSMQGFTFTFFPALYPTRRQVLPYLLGGVLANFLLAGIGLLLWYWLSWGKSFWLMVAVINGLYLSNLIPMRVRVGVFHAETDGALVLRALWRGLVSGPPTGRIYMAQAMDELWRKVGDQLGRFVFGLEAVLAWCELGHLPQARRLLAEIETYPLETTPFSNALLALVRSSVARLAGHREEAGRDLDEASAHFAQLHHEAGALMIAIERIDLLLDQSQAQEAAQRVQGLLAHPLVQNRPSVRVNLLAAQLISLAHLQEIEALKPLRSEYERLRKNHLGWRRDLSVFQALARLHSAREEWPAAERAYSEALEAANQIQQALTGLGEPYHVPPWLRTLQNEYDECLRRQGREGTAPLMQPPKARKKREKIAGPWQRRLEMAGVSLLLLGVLVGAALVGWGSQWSHGLTYWRAGGAPFQTLVVMLDGSHPAGQAGVGLLMLAGLFLTPVLAIQLVGRLLLARWVRVGPIVLLMGLVPWIVAGMILVESFSNRKPYSRDPAAAARAETP